MCVAVGLYSGPGYLGRVVSAPPVGRWSQGLWAAPWGESSGSLSSHQRLGPPAALKGNIDCRVYDLMYVVSYRERTVLERFSKSNTETLKVSFHIMATSSPTTCVHFCYLNAFHDVIIPCFLMIIVRSLMPWDGNAKLDISQTKALLQEYTHSHRNTQTLVGIHTMWQLYTHAERNIHTLIGLHTLS